MFGWCWFKDEPADIDPHLHHGEGEADHHAGRGAGAGGVGLLSWEYSGDSVGFGHHSSVAEGVAETFTDKYRMITATASDFVGSV